MKIREKIRAVTTGKGHLQLISVEIKQSEPEHKVSWHLKVQAD